MGTFTTTLQVADPATLRFVDVEALADTGATHTLLPRDLLLGLGVEPMDRVAFELADERQIEYDIGEVRIRLDGRERTVVAVFGPEGSRALLADTTLELFNLAVDPVRRRILRVPGLLKRGGMFAATV